MSNSETCETCDPGQNDGDGTREVIKVPVENVLDPSTFIPPSALPGPGVVIEFCNRCRWLHRATWVQTELFLTFPPPTLGSITVIPYDSAETGGRFRVWLAVERNSTPELIWDRKTQGGFPELKDLKQRIRDKIAPGTSLGHSDKHPVTQP
ncbi:hypothetical protein BS47DRAFT_1384130 [Hydnum rufescens UP504]|uniref:Rdx family-domain-containing protein n=1 Tax=Hydnum rufescens UP504 TaxID=1448309 RepID=A0A9P6DTY2_9AGAM|nr:hypothetical protein BS47DRAFT_1384130 [Hydnum rufescens UP504]